MSSNMPVLMQSSNNVCINREITCNIAFPQQQRACVVELMAASEWAHGHTKRSVIGAGGRQLTPGCVLVMRRAQYEYCIAAPSSGLMGGWFPWQQYLAAPTQQHLHVGSGQVPVAVSHDVATVGMPSMAACQLLQSLQAVGPAVQLVQHSPYGAMTALVCSAGSCGTSASHCTRSCRSEASAVRYW